MLPHISLNRELTPLVMEEVLKIKTVSIGSLRTVADFLVMLASWFYDLNYAPSRSLAAKNHILERIERELPKTETVDSLFRDVKDRL